MPLCLLIVPQIITDALLILLLGANRVSIRLSELSVYVKKDKTNVTHEVGSRDTHLPVCTPQIMSLHSKFGMVGLLPAFFSYSIEVQRGPEENELIFQK